MNVTAKAVPYVAPPVSVKAPEPVETVETIAQPVNVENVDLITPPMDTNLLIVIIAILVVLAGIGGIARLMKTKPSLPEQELPTSIVDDTQDTANKKDA